ncbi:MAG: hypothetical protein MUP04_01755 [Anaerolineae bacterium]|nr:hypothetical protein [Anaerolineae bacterium]
MKRLILNAPLENITAVGFHKRPFILATKTCMLLSYQDGASGRPREAVIITAHLHSWCERIAELLSEKGMELKVRGVMTADDVVRARRERGKEILAEIHGGSPSLSLQDPKGQDPVGKEIGEGDLRRVVEALDPASAQIVWHLWENRHAKIEELRRVLGESSHMNVLVRIKEAINPTALKILGRPILVFERARIDRSSGERILYSWWLSGDAERRPIEGERLVDIFDEGDHILVIVELVGFEEKGIRLAVEDETFVVEAEAPGRSVHEEIPLPLRVDGQRLKASYRNNMLQVRFEKEETG